MEYVNAIYKGGLDEDYFLKLTEYETYKGFIINSSLYISDDESSKKIDTHRDLKEHINCYCIENINKDKFYIEYL